MDNLASSRAPGHGERHAALLSAAVRVLDRDGMRRLTYRSVAQEAGKATAWCAITSAGRDALIHEAVLDHADRSLESTRLESGTGRLADLGAGTTRMVTDVGRTCPGSTTSSSSRRGAARSSRPAVHALYDRYLDATRRELARIGLGDDEPLVRLVFAALDGLVIQLLVFGRVDEADAAIARLHELLADRLAPEAR